MNIHWKINSRSWFDTKWKVRIPYHGYTTILWGEYPHYQLNKRKKKNNK